MAAAASASWEDLRRQARKLEGDVDHKLAAYARLGGGGGGGGGGEEELRRVEIEALLAQLGELNAAMAAHAASGSGADALGHTLARHRDILHEYSQVPTPAPNPPAARWRATLARGSPTAGRPWAALQEFRRTRTNVAATRDHALLLGSSLTRAREDDDGLASGALSAQQALLRERGTLHSATAQVSGCWQQLRISEPADVLHARPLSCCPPGCPPSVPASHSADPSLSLKIDDVVGQAQSTAAALSQQRLLFGDISGKVTTTGLRFPESRLLRAFAMSTEHQLSSQMPNEPIVIIHTPEKVTRHNHHIRGRGCLHGLHASLLALQMTSGSPRSKTGGGSITTTATAGSSLVLTLENTGKAEQWTRAAVKAGQSTVYRRGKECINF
eukprot:SM000097S24756  [mRNA]  locus=s97:6131:7981:- [translate_table: standard]